jgi:hypothetical protein
MPLKDITTTDLLALWGAIIATLVLIWDIIKWFREGPKVQFSVYPNMVMIPEMSGDKSRRYIRVDVKNIGDRAFTVESLTQHLYPGRFSKRASDSWVVAHFTQSTQLPLLLEPGRVWMGMFMQDAQMETNSREGYFTCELHCSYRKKPLKKRLIIPQKSNENG